MTKINLLPEEYSLKTGFSAVLKILKSLTLILTLLFIFFVISASAILLISSLSLNGLVVSNESLKSEIKSREATETKLVLLKDRLSKIKLVTSQGMLTKSLDDIEPVLAEASNATVGELSLDSEKTDTSLTFTSSASLSAFLQSLTTSSVFSSIVMNSFGLNPATGYLISLRFTGK